MSSDLPRKKSSVFDDLKSLIPGYSGYSKLESRREDDRITRKFLVSRLANCKSTLEKIARTAIESGNLDTPVKLEKIRTRIDLAQSRVAAAVEGYAGWFGQRKVDIDLLQRVGDLDASLISVVDELDSLLQKCSEDVPAGNSAEVAGLLDTLHERIDRRRQLLQEEVG